jgi:hypothetical protein
MIAFISKSRIRKSIEKEIDKLLLKGRGKEKDLSMERGNS